jgi:hypothetical protein
MTHMELIIATADSFTNPRVMAVYPVMLCTISKRAMIRSTLARGFGLK